MKKIVLLFALLTCMSSCSDYLSVELQNALTLEETFNKRSTTEAYLALLVVGRALAQHE